MRAVRSQLARTQPNWPVFHIQPSVFSASLFPAALPTANHLVAWMLSTCDAGQQKATPSGEVVKTSLLHLFRRGKTREVLT